MHNWRIAARTLWRRPGYTLAAVLMLTLGIGATTTLFSVVDTILLKPLRYPDPGRLVSILEAAPLAKQRESLIAPGRLEDWNRMNRTFEFIAGINAENFTETSGAEPQRLAGWRVTPRFFETYKTKPLAGRVFIPKEEVNGGPLAAVISYGFWTRRFGQDPAAIGKRLIIGGQGCTVVGIMPKEFVRRGVDLWIPAQTRPLRMLQREARYMSGVGRMKPGVTIEQAQADLARVQSELGEQYPRTDKGWSASVTDLKEARVGGSRRTLLLLFGAMALLLLIAVSNIGGLTLAQLRRRAGEMAVRCSIGASRGQIVATVLREVLWIASFGAILGGLAAAWGVRAMAIVLADFPRAAELHVDGRSLAFAILASFVAAILFGVMPALQSTRGNLAGLLAESWRAVSESRGRLQGSLVIAQLAVTVVLLSSAGLLLRSYHNLSQVDPGFNSANVVTFHVGASWTEDRPMIGRMQMQILEALRRFPRVESAGLTSFLPATGASGRAQVEVEGLAETMEGATYTVGGRVISPGYLEALKVPLLAGSWCPALRPFELNGANKTLVNRAFVDQYAKGQNIIGRHTLYPMSALANPPMNEIVGVIGDVREDGLAVPPAPYVYDCVSAGSWPDPEYVVRVRGDAGPLMQNLSRIVHGVDPNRAVFGVKMLDSVLEDVLEQPRLNSRFLATFAGAAMLLASIGLYSLISLLVTSRTREIGLRIALGAGRAQIAGLVLAGAGRLVGAGVAAGFILALAAGRVIKAVLFGVSPLDAVALAVAIVALAFVSALAAILPARRAVAIDPVRAMRME